MNKMVHMMLTLTIIGIISGASLFFVNDWATPLIAANQAKELKIASSKVLPSANEFVIQKSQIADEEFIYYKGLAENGELVGYVLPWAGKGFQSMIRVIMGISPDLTTILSVKIKHSETPGFGDVLTSAFFIDQFVEKSTGSDCQVLMNKGGKAPAQENSISTKTGATVSQSAAIRTINKGLENLKIAVANAPAEEPKIESSTTANSETAIIKDEQVSTETETTGGNQ